MKKKKIYIVILILGISAVIIWVLLLNGKKQVVTLQIAVVEKGNIVNTVTATGTVEPIDKVDVGTQVSGVINTIYVDFNTMVKKGQLLAEIDKSTLKARLLQSQADLSSAQNELTYQEQNYNRTKKLYEASMVSEVNYESAQYKYNNAKASVDRLKSELEQAEVNLSYASIYSPIDGVILARNVEQGQTVAASFSTPTLFSIAKDLTKMKVEANVDEADIGQVKVDQKVTFTVDAFPEDKFEGKVIQIRLNPTVSSNVVTYKVIVEAPNPDLKLMPGLTASINIITKEATGVLVVSTKALHFTPDQDVVEKYIPKPPRNQKIQDENVEFDSAEANKSPSTEMVSSTPKNIKQVNGENMVWVKIDNAIHSKKVKTGLGDGTLIEIQDGLSEGDSVVTSSTKTQITSSKSAQAQSPFMPKMPQRNRKN